MCQERGYQIFGDGDGKLGKLRERGEVEKQNEKVRWVQISHFFIDNGYCK